VKAFICKLPLHYFVLMFVYIVVRRCQMHFLKYKTMKMPYEHRHVDGKVTMISDSRKGIFSATHSIVMLINFCILRLNCNCKIISVLLQIMAQISV
jgi:hypothetical protein